MLADGFLNVKTCPGFRAWEERTGKHPFYCKAVSQGDDSPAIMVSWHDVWKFCLWMSNNDSDLFRLPFANEWSQVYRRGLLALQRRTKKNSCGLREIRQLP